MLLKNSCSTLTVLSQLSLLGEFSPSYFLGLKNKITCRVDFPIPAEVLKLTFFLIIQLEAFCAFKRIWAISDHDWATLIALKFFPSVTSSCFSGLAWKHKSLWWNLGMPETRHWDKLWDGDRFTCVNISATGHQTPAARSVWISMTLYNSCAVNMVWVWFIAAIFTGHFWALCHF